MKTYTAEEVHNIFLRPHNEHNSFCKEFCFKDFIAVDELKKWIEKNQFGSTYWNGLVLSEQLLKAIEDKE